MRKAVLILDNGMKIRLHLKEKDVRRLISQPKGPFVKPKRWTRAKDFLKRIWKRRPG
jgi:hypothetical protein